MPYKYGPASGFNQSAVASYLRCKHQWYLATVERLVPRVTRPALQLGTLVHKGIEAALYMSVETADWNDPQNQDDAYFGVIENAVSGELQAYLEQHKLFNEEIEELMKLALKATRIAHRSAANLLKDFEPIEIGGELAIEFRVTVPVKKNKVYDHFHGTIDLVARERQSGMLWLIDHKVRGTLQPIEDEEVNIQMVAYQYALLKTYGIKTVGSIAHQIFSELPAEPKVNKNGEISKAACKTDWATYRAAVVREGQNPDDYLEMAQKLQEVEFWRYSRAYRSEREITNVWQEIILNTASDMARKVKRLPRSLSAWNCKGCQFRTLCLEELRGGDIEYLKATDFQVRPQDQESIPVVQEGTQINVHQV